MIKLIQFISELRLFRKGVFMTNYVKAKEIVELMGVSEGKAYKIIRQLNDELKAAGYLTVAGRVSRKYFEERIYSYDTGRRGA